MNLSMNRAYNVANFIFYKCSNKPYQKELALWIQKQAKKKQNIVDKTRTYL